MQPQEIQLDANEILQRIANIDSNLYNRVIAEAQRDRLLAMVNEMSDDNSVETIPEEAEDE